MLNKAILQIRLSEEIKEGCRRQAAELGQTLSSWVILKLTDRIIDTPQGKVIKPLPRKFVPASGQESVVAAVKRPETDEEKLARVLALGWPKQGMALRELNGERKAKGLPMVNQRGEVIPVRGES